MDSETRDAFERLERNLRGEIEARVAGVRSHFDARLVETQGALETRIVESEERTRRHFDVVAESLRADIRLLADGSVSRLEASRPRRRRR